MLNVGIIGLGPDWESRYRPALARLSRRLRVAAVYDAVTPRAARAAEDLSATCVTGIRALLNRPDVRAVLILDDAWQGLAPLRFALDSRKPLYVATPLTAPHVSLDALCRQAADQSVLIAPALPLRTAPATTRIHELVATQLGPVEHIRVAADWSEAAQVLPGVVAVIDWCSELFRSVPTAVDVRSQSAQGVEILVTFRRVGRDGQPAAATIGLSFSAAPAPRLTAVIVCRNGDMRLTDASELDWRCGEHAAHERLDLERSDIETLLDHFARRIVGGLVPVPGLDDVCRILQLLEPHRESIAGVCGADGTSI